MVDGRLVRVGPGEGSAVGLEEGEGVGIRLGL